MPGFSLLHCGKAEHALPSRVHPACTIAHQNLAAIELKPAANSFNTPGHSTADLKTMV